MTSTVREYETIFILDPGLEEAKEKEEVDRVAKLIKDLDGSELGGRNLRVNVAEERRPRPAPAANRGWTDAPPKDAWASKPKGSRRNIRGRKRSL